jgi:hypothetical protein
MLGSRSHEQKVTLLEWIPPSVMKEDAPATDNNVNFVLGVWSRWPWERREATERKHGLQGAALQKADGVLTRGTGNIRLGLGKMDHMATARRVHGQLKVREKLRLPAATLAGEYSITMLDEK